METLDCRAEQVVCLADMLHRDIYNFSSPCVVGKRDCGFIDDPPGFSNLVVSWGGVVLSWKGDRRSHAPLVFLWAS